MTQQNPFMNSKTQRLKQLLKILTPMEEVSYLKAIALDEFNFGVSNKVARNDMSTLINLDALERVGAKLKIKQKSLSPSHSGEVEDKD